LRDARAVLFTCDEERRKARQSFWLYKCREAIINYGTAGSTGEPQQQLDLFVDRFPEVRSKRVVLFLGRIHPKKGCDLLLEAFARVAVRNQDLHLVMAGPDQLGWQAALSAQAVALGISSRITWSGMLTGNLKWGAYLAAEVFILPSHAENFGLVIAEALSRGVPVLLSDKVNIWREIIADGAGLAANDDVAGTTSLLERWLALSAREKETMRSKAKQCFVNRYEIGNVAESMIEMLRAHGVRDDVAAASAGQHGYCAAWDEGGVQHGRGMQPDGKANSLQRSATEFCGGPTVTQKKNILRVLVTGGSGFIGTNLVNSLLKSGHEVLSLDKKPPMLQVHRSFFKQLDILDKSSLEAALDEFRPTHICHLAARTDLGSSTANDYQDNTAGTVNLRNAAARTKSVIRVLFFSTRFVCRTSYIPKHDFDYCPHTAYGESKIAMEKFLFAGGETPYDWCVLRPTSIWGPWFEEPYKTFFLTIRKGRYLHPGKRRIVKSFGYVGNTVFQIEKFLLASHDLIHRKVFHLADYEPIDVFVWANEIRRQMDAPKIRSAPIPILKAIALLGDFAKLCGMPKPPLTSFRLGNMLCPMVYNLESTRNVAGELPFSMPAGVSATVEWLNAQDGAYASRSPAAAAR
jgi:nucleoside-diphosphate-sugar epimerase